MSKPVLYLPTETIFLHNGIGILNDCTYCMVTEEINGQFELEMRYPMDGIHCSEIVDRSIIKARANKGAKPQLFRVYAISKPMSGIISVYAAHISYDLSGIPVSPFSADTPSEAMTKLGENAVIGCPFSFSAEDVMTWGEFKVEFPSSIRSRMFNGSDGILGVFGGEYEFDNFNVILRGKRGENRGVSVRYGKNLRSLKQDRNSDQVYSGVYPFWYNSETGDLVELDGKIMDAPRPVEDQEIQIDFEKIKIIDLSGEFNGKPTKSQLEERTIQYLEENKINVPFVSLSVSFSQLENEEFYKDMNLLENVFLGDTINVEFPALGVSSAARVVETEYNVILDRVENVILGSKKALFTDNVVSGGSVNPVAIGGITPSSNIL